MRKKNQSAVGRLYIMIIKCRFIKTAYNIVSYIMTYYSDLKRPHYECILRIVGIYLKYRKDILNT